MADSSILSEELNQRGFHTITLFGLDLPYHLFEKDNDQVRNGVVKKYLAGINPGGGRGGGDRLIGDPNRGSVISSSSEKKENCKKNNFKNQKLSKMIYRKIF